MPKRIVKKPKRKNNGRSGSVLAKGNSLRSTIATLLRSRYGTSAVQEEVKLVGEKAADIVFTASDLPAMRPRIAVECKNWSQPLVARDIREIRSEYHDAYAKGDISGLYIISPLDVSASVRAVVDNIHWITFLTFAQFQASIIDFSGYLAHLQRDFSRDGLDEYYVSSRLSDGRLLHDQIIVPWLEQKNAKPLALVAGYGMGKTTYSRFLAHHLAATALQNFDAPIPILLPLGAVAQQQSIRSLISYLFADQFRVPGYTYNLFDVLNSAGRFVILFDAFDEMKHAMSSNDIKHNLEEIKNLISSKTKAILIGRPDPFLSDDEFKLLEGREKVIGRLAPTRRLKEFEIEYLGYFNDEDIENFMRKYMALILKERNFKKKDAVPYIERQIKEFKRSNYYELARRPVQAKMIAELLVTPDFQPNQLGIYHLYEHFVSYVMERESKKVARSNVGMQQRLTFLRKVAWWLWTEKGERYFTYAELPRDIVNIVSSYKSATNESLVRELLIGSLLDRQTSGLFETKGSDYYYFAHKSYWEFLVCDYLLKAELSERDINLVSQRITPQLIEFLASAKENSYNELYRKLTTTRAFTHLQLFEMASRSPLAPVPFEHDNYLVTKNQMLMTAIVVRNNGQLVEFKEWEDYFFAAEKKGAGNFTGMMFGLLYVAASDKGQKNRAIGALSALCAIGASKWLDKKQRAEDFRVVQTELDADEETGVIIFLHSIESIDKDGLVVDCDACVNYLIESNFVSVEETSFERRIGSEYVDLQDLDRLSEFREGVDFLNVLRAGYTRVNEDTVSEIEG